MKLKQLIKVPSGKEIQRCQAISLKTKKQCGNPACLKDKFCTHHKDVVVLTDKEKLLKQHANRKEQFKRKESWEKMIEAAINPKKILQQITPWPRQFTIIYRYD